MSENKPENLRRRALLNLLASMLDYGSLMLVTLVTTPYLVNLLGDRTFGIWKMLQQSGNYLIIGDLKSSTTLTYVVAGKRSSSTGEELRRFFSSCFWANLATIPFYLVLSGLLIYLTPHLVKALPDQVKMVRLVATIIAAGYILSQNLFIFEALLTGMNLSYKRMGVRLGLNLLEGGGIFLSLFRGWGLPGLALISLTVIVINGLTFYFIARHNVPWLGLIKISGRELLRWIRLSLGFMGDKIILLLTTSIDIVLIGYFLDAAQVTTYVVTRFAVVAVFGIISKFIGAASPGMIKILTGDNPQNLIPVRTRLCNLVLFLFTGGGCLIGLLNHSFIQVWTGTDNYAGPLANACIVILYMLRSLSNIDGGLISGALLIRKKNIISGTAAVLSIGLAVLLMPVWGINGFVIGFLVGTFFQYSAFLFVLQQLLKTLTPFYRNLRFWGAVALILLAAAGSRWIRPDSWSTLILQTILWGTLAMSTALLTVVDRASRKYYFSIFSNWQEILGSSLKHSDGTEKS